MKTLASHFGLVNNLRIVSPEKNIEAHGLFKILLGSLSEAQEVSIESVFVLFFLR